LAEVATTENFIPNIRISIAGRNSPQAARREDSPRMGSPPLSVDLAGNMDSPVPIPVRSAALITGARQEASPRAGTQALEEDSMAAGTAAGITRLSIITRQLPSRRHYEDTQSEGNQR